MRGIDLLALLTDLNKNAALLAQDGKTNIQITKVDLDQDGTVCLHTSTTGKSLRRWELTLLLDRSEYRPGPVNLVLPNGTRPVYGLHFLHGDIILH